MSFTGMVRVPARTLTRTQQKNRGDSSFRHFGKSASAILTSLGKGKGKVKAITVQANYRSRGFQEVEAPRFLDNRHTNVVRL